MNFTLTLKNQQLRLPNGGGGASHMRFRDPTSPWAYQELSTCKILPLLSVPTLTTQFLTYSPPKGHPALLLAKLD